MNPTIFERGGYVYLVSDVAPFEPADSEVEAFSFASQIREIAPNPNLLWLHGRYAEAGHPVDHGTHSLEWSAADLAIKSLTPVFCPVTVMHDPRTAVGLIADTKLTPGDATGPTRIDNTLAVWAHRFPEVAQEISANHRRGTLMQSQECRPAYWECATCEQKFTDKPAIEHHQATEHSALNRKPTRKLGNVTFTGTGLIFGTRGARGALSTATLDVLADEVSEFHERSRSNQTARAPRRQRTVDIEQKDYEALVQKAGKVDDLTARISQLEEESAKVPELTRRVEQLEVEKKNAEDARDAEKSRREQLEEQSRAATLSGERMRGLGSGFMAKLPDTIKTRLGDQAKTMSDDDWKARLEELSALVGVAVDASDGNNGGQGGGQGQGGQGSQAGEFNREETSRSGAAAGGGQGNAGEASRAATTTVVGGLLRRIAPPVTTPGQKS